MTLTSTSSVYGAASSTYRWPKSADRAGAGVSGSANTREDELARQLDARLSGRLARIRSQIQPAGGAGATDGPGQILDLRV